MMPFIFNQTQATVTVSIIDDSTVESNETFGFIVQRNASDPVGTYLAKSTFTIVDNDTTQSTTYAITNPSTVSEVAGSITFTITRSGNLPAETIYASTTQTEGFTNSNDYTGVAGRSMAFTTNQTQASVIVSITDDSTVESNETFGFIVQRSTLDAVSVYLAKTTFTIIDNDSSPSTTYAITNPATVNEGAGSITVTITRSGGLPAETIYASTTQTEGYTNSNDYTGIASQGVTFAANQSQATVTVSIIDDSTVESNETFGFIVQRNASDPVGTYLAKSTFTIVDNDTLPPPPSLSNVSPNSYPASTGNQTMTLNGSSFVTGATLTFVPPEGGTIASTASKLAFVSSSQLSYQFNNGSDVGTWSVKVNNPDGQSSGSVSFTVTSGASTAPALINVSPTSYPASTSNQTMTLNGSNFVNGATLTFVPPEGGIITSTASKLTFVSGSQLTYQFNDGNDVGTWSVKVNNPNGQSSGSVSFTVNSNSNHPPQITSPPTANPNPAYTGQQIQFTAAASDIDNDALIFSWTFGDGEIGSGTSVSHVYPASGLYNVTVTVSDGKSGMITQGLTVNVETEATKKAQTRGAGKALG